MMTPKRNRFATCPLCGSNKIKQVRGVYSLRLEQKTLRVADLVRDECPTCGEKFVDYWATKQIEAARAALVPVRSKRKRVA